MATSEYGRAHRAYGLAPYSACCACGRQRSNALARRCSSAPTQHARAAYSTQHTAHSTQHAGGTLELDTGCSALCRSVEQRRCTALLVLKSHGRTASLERRAVESQLVAGSGAGRLPWQRGQSEQRPDSSVASLLPRGNTVAVVTRARVPRFRMAVQLCMCTFSCGAGGQRFAPPARPPGLTREDLTFAVTRRLLSLDRIRRCR